MPRAREEDMTMAPVPHMARMVPHIIARAGVNTGSSLHRNIPPYQQVLVITLLCHQLGLATATSWIKSGRGRTPNLQMIPHTSYLSPS